MRATTSRSRFRQRIASKVKALLEQPDSECNAIGCSTRVPPTKFMCDEHFYWLPPAFREYLETRETPYDVVNPSKLLTKERDRAVRLVARLEAEAERQMGTN